MVYIKKLCWIKKIYVNGGLYVTSGKGFYFITHDFDHKKVDTGR